MIDLAKGLFEVVLYDSKRTITIVNLVKTTWLSRYLRAIEITYEQAVFLIGHEFRISLTGDEYVITAKPSTSWNTISNTTLEQIHQVLEDLVRNFNTQKTYIDKNDPWKDILDVAAFAIILTTNRQEDYILGQLIFGHDIILP